MADREIIELQTKLTADDQASKKIDDVADKVDGLTKKPVEVELKADDQASGDIKQVAQAAQDLADKPYQIEFKLDQGNVTKSLDNLETQLRNVVDQAKAIGQETVTLHVNTSDIEGLQKELQDTDAEVTKIDDHTATVKISTEGLEGVADKVHNVSDEVDKAGKHAISSAGDFRDIAGAFGNVDTTALDATEGIIGLGQALEGIAGDNKTLQGIVGALGELAGPAAIAATLMIGLGQGFDAFSDVFVNLDGNIKAFQASLGASGSGSTAFQEEMLKNVENATDFQNKIDDIKRIFTGWTPAGFVDLAGDIFRDGTKALDVFNDTMKTSPSLARAFLDVLKDMGPAISQADFAKAAGQITQYELAAVQASTGQEKLEPRD